MDLSKARTHDISLVDYHVRDVESFGKKLTEAVAAAFPKDGRTRYKEVHVLLLSWAEDNLGVAKEVLELQEVFHNTYCYETQRYNIPSTESFKCLRKQITGFLNDYESKENLLIVYYGGHGHMDDERRCIWSCTGVPESPTVHWYGLQTLLEQAESDVLILLDCCAAASSCGGSGSGVTEVIAACGFETWAPTVGEHSFSRSLIDELEYWSHQRPSLSAAMLHSKVLSRIKCWKPRFEMTGGQRCVEPPERRKTPIHIVLSEEGAKRSIELTPIQSPPLAELPTAMEQDIDESPSSENLIWEGQEAPPQGFSGYSGPSLQHAWPGHENQCSHKVLISVALEDDQRLSTTEWADWVRMMPGLVKSANIEGIYRSDSVIVLVSIPVAVWDMLSQDPAMMFIGFIRSANLIEDRLWTSTAERAREEGVPSKESPAQVFTGAGIEDSTHVDLSQHQWQEHFDPPNLPTLASKHKVTEAATGDPNLTWQSSARSKTQPTVWYCHSCNSGPYNLQSTLTCPDLLSTGSLCGHQRCRYCLTNF